MFRLMRIHVLIISEAVISTLKAYYFLLLCLCLKCSIIKCFKEWGFEKAQNSVKQGF